MRQQHRCSPRRTRGSMPALLLLLAGCAPARHNPENRGDRAAKSAFGNRQARRRPRSAAGARWSRCAGGDVPESPRHTPRLPSRHGFLAVLALLFPGAGSARLSKHAQPGTRTWAYHRRGMKPRGWASRRDFLFARDRRTSARWPRHPKMSRLHVLPKRDACRPPEPRTRGLGRLNRCHAAPCCHG